MSKTQQSWAFIADPEDFGWNELAASGSAVWDGVRNPVAQRHMRSCRVGDRVLIYHTAPDKALVGVARVSGAARPDPKDAARVVVDVTAVQPLARALPLAELKGDDVLAELSFVRMPRVAVQPVTQQQFDRVLALSGTRI